MRDFYFTVRYFCKERKKIEEQPPAHQTLFRAVRKNFGGNSKY